jgi:hypothetical protein
MVDQAPEFESADKKGSTDVYDGVVGTGWTAIPTTPGNKIQEFSVMNPFENTITKYLEISLDGGTTIYDRIYPSGHVSDLIKSDSKTQIHIRGQSSSVAYKVILDRETT